LRPTHQLPPSEGIKGGEPEVFEHLSQAHEPPSRGLRGRPGVAD
jgi:hypothetical protein